MDKSFYGGSQGKSFTIRKIFNSKKDMIENDLNMRWQSPINVGDIVIISYGLPNSSSYETNKQADLDKFEGKTYNSTLWQKIYTESPSDQKDELTGIEVEWAIENYGLGYKLLASMTGNTPKINAETGEPVGAGYEPSIDFNANDIDNPILTLHLPRAQEIQMQPRKTIGPEEEPDIEYKDHDEEDPSRNPELMSKPELTFYLPRAARFYYGDKLDTKTETTLSNPGDYKKGDYYINEGTGFVYKITDAPEGSDCTVEFVACLIAPSPTTEYEVLKPYQLDASTGEYVIPEPTVKSGYTDPENETGWKFTFSLQQVPNIELNQTESSFEFCGADEEGSGLFSGEPVSESTFEITYDLTIPRGSRIFTGAEISGAANSTVVISDAKPGDSYLNNEGNLYILVKEADDSLVWYYKTNLQGPDGNPIEFVSGVIEITSEEVPTFNDANIGAYLMDASGGGLTNYPTQYQVVPVNYIDNSNLKKSYYFLYDGTNWSSLLLSGDAAIFANTKIADDNNRAYSTTYINNLETAIYTDISWGTFADAIKDSMASTP